MQRNALFQVPYMQPDFDPEEASYSVLAMQTLIDRKKCRLEQKAEALNCYVLRNISELKHFLVWLDSIKATLPNHSRFQYILKYGPHWSSADIKIRNGRLEFFLLDSIHSRNTFIHTIEVIKAINPDAMITVSSGMPLQRDEKNCGTFTYDFACQMAKIPYLHEKINLFAQPIQKTNGLGHALFHCELDGTLRTLDVNHFPPELGPLLRNVQDVPKGSIWFKRGHYANIHLSLNDYITKAGHAQETVEGTLTSDAVIQKRKKIKIKAGLFHAVRQEQLHRDPFVPDKCRL